MARSNADAVRAQHEHFTRTGRVLEEIYHSDAEWMAAQEDPDAATHRGLEAIKGYFAQWSEAFEEVEFGATEITEVDDKVFAWIRFAGRGPVSGAPVAMEQAQVWRFRDGKVARVEEYFDRDQGLAAAGLER